jgi:hypothetical protein
MAATVLVMLPGAATAGSGGGNDKAAPLDLARDYLQKNKQDLGLTGADVKDAVVTDMYTDAHNGVTHIYFQQQHKGIEVQTSNLGVHMTSDGTVASVGGSFVSNLAAEIRGESAKQDARSALVHAARELGLSPARLPGEGTTKGGPEQAVVFDGAGLSATPIPAKLVYVPTGSGVRLGWNVQIEEASGLHWWNASVDAETGALLFKDDFIADAGYNVYALPKESPTDGPRTLETDPHDPAASPFGWHDTNGAAGAEFTRTQGNNVHAYADRDNNNITDPGSDPDGGPGLVFDFALDFTKRPLDSQAAVVTNLFYWNNVIHDVAYGYGFTEAAGNFQVNNYGKGGLGTDYVRAEAQDGSGRNNANFGTPAEPPTLPTQVPRMQMFEWRSSTPNPILVNTGALAGQTFFGPMAGFGESLVTTGPITGDVVYVGRGCDPVYQPTTPPTPPIPLDPYLADPAGKIALIDRGICTFTAKVKKAQDNGALMVIVANNAAGPATAMGGADPTITIPSVMISLADATTWMANGLPFNVTVSDGTGGVPDRDSDVDNGVIVHEYGHGISNRLTGGPATVSCLSTVLDAEQMGEGWSDYLALVMTHEPGDTATTPRGIGTYVVFQGEDGVGIRPTEYTTNMAINPSTYDTIKDEVNITEPHGVGYVWATMLWEVYWNLIAKYGYNPDVYDEWFTGGNNLAIQLVFDGMKLQRCLPSFVDGRNAILQADTLLTGGANQCEIWRGFAKRGLGTGADDGVDATPPVRGLRTDGTQSFTVPATCAAAASSFRPPINQAPTLNSPVLNDRQAGATVPLKYTVTGLAAGQAVTLDSQQVDCVTLIPTGSSTPIQTSGTLRQRGDEYHDNWVTSATWAGTCRRLTLKVAGASSSVAYFRFN